MRKLIAICIICNIPCFSAIADTMVVKVPVLNVRSCPSTDCNIINKLSKGDKVNVSDTNMGWAKIETDKDKTGYVINRSLRKSYAYLWWYIILILIVCGLCDKFYENVKIKRKQLAEQEREERWKLATKCPKCGTLGAMTDISRECIGQKDSKIIKVTKTQYKDYTKTQEHLVPATTYTYRVKTTCTNCGHTVISTETKKVEN